MPTSHEEASDWLTGIALEASGAVSSWTERSDCELEQVVPSLIEGELWLLHNHTAVVVGFTSHERADLHTVQDVHLEVREVQGVGSFPSEEDGRLTGHSSEGSHTGQWTCVKAK